MVQSDKVTLFPARGLFLDPFFPRYATTSHDSGRCRPLQCHHPPAERLTSPTVIPDILLHIFIPTKSLGPACVRTRGPANPSLSA
jgi:hypothetical protein